LGFERTGQCCWRGKVIMLMLHRNGGQAAPVTHGARFILLWARAILETKTLTSNNQSSWCRLILPVSRSRECCLFTVMTMLLTDMVTSHSRTFVYQQVTWFLALVVDLRLSKAVLAPDVFITPCVLLVLYVEQSHCTNSADAFRPRKHLNGC
jgi:hypothetical protein